MLKESGNWTLYYSVLLHFSVFLCSYTYDSTYQSINKFFMQLNLMGNTKMCITWLQQHNWETDLQTFRQFVYKSNYAGISYENKLLEELTSTIKYQMG